jgi:ABC-type antimicrobial peptide transport system permease subunit
MVAGLVVGAVVASIVGGIASWQWGEAKKIEAQGKSKGSTIFADELEKWLPWVLIAIAIIIAVVVIIFLWWKFR